MDYITNNPGLQYITEEIFVNLNHENLLKCEKVNGIWNNVLSSNPTFWLKACVKKGLISGQDHEDWSKLIQTLKNVLLKKHVVFHLKEIHKHLKSPYNPKSPFFKGYECKDLLLLRHYLANVDSTILNSNRKLSSDELIQLRRCLTYFHFSVPQCSQTCALWRTLVLL